MNKLAILAASIAVALPSAGFAATPQSSIGRILLDVESKGEAWYVNPANLKRYYMENGAAAYRIMSKLGLGASASSLKLIPIAKTSAQPPEAMDDDLAAVMAAFVEVRQELLNGDIEDFATLSTQDSRTAMSFFSIFAGTSGGNAQQTAEQARFDTVEYRSMARSGSDIAVTAYLSKDGDMGEKKLIFTEGNGTWKFNMPKSNASDSIQTPDTAAQPDLDLIAAGLAKAFSTCDYRYIIDHSTPETATMISGRLAELETRSCASSAMSVQRITALSGKAEILIGETSVINTKELNLVLKDGKWLYDAMAS